MFPYLWIPVTVLASVFQVARNGLQRGLMPATGPWGATLVRFLFGLPFSLAFTLVAWSLTPGASAHLGMAFWASATVGALAQVLATASLLVAMRRAGFAVGTAMQQSSLPLAAILGLVIYHDRLSGLAWGGVAVTTAGLAVLTWPKGASGPPACVRRGVRSAVGPIFRIFAQRLSSCDPGAGRGPPVVRRGRQRQLGASHASGGADPVAGRV